MNENLDYSEDKHVMPIKAKQEEGLWELIKVVVQALLIAVVVRTLLFQPFNIPSGSLIPTLLVGDYLFVSKYAYGYSKHSMPFSPNLFSGRIMGSDPKRGDVAVFKVPKDNTTDYVKRVIGLPGDSIKMTGGELYINGQKVPRHLVSNTSKDVGAGLRDTFSTYEETLPNGVTHLIQTKNNPDSLMNNTVTYTLPPGQFFMMGDNRDNSSDSRDWGFVPLENFVGRAEIIFFSVKTVSSDSEDNTTEPAWQIWRWPEIVRWNRLFKPVR